MRNKKKHISPALGKSPSIVNCNFPSTGEIPECWEPLDCKNPRGGGGGLPHVSSRGAKYFSNQKFPLFSWAYNLINLHSSSHLNLSLAQLTTSLLMLLDDYYLNKHFGSTAMSAKEFWVLNRRLMLELCCRHWASYSFVNRLVIWANFTVQWQFLHQ